MANILQHEHTQIHKVRATLKKTYNNIVGTIISQLILGERTRGSRPSLDTINILRKRSIYYIFIHSSKYHLTLYTTSDDERMNTRSKLTIKPQII